MFHCKQEHMVPWPQAAQGHTPTLHLDPPLKNATFMERSLWDLLVVAVTEIHEGLQILFEGPTNTYIEKSFSRFLEN